jgi:hypothetical protein
VKMDGQRVAQVRVDPIVDAERMRKDSGELHVEAKR